MSKGPIVRDARSAKMLGVGCIVAGSWLLYDAYEARGNTKPWFLKWLPAA